MTSDREMIGKLALQDDRIASEASAWLLRQREGDMAADAWLEFSDWLDADSRHAAAFDAVVEADEALDALDPARLDEVEAEPEPQQRQPAWRRPALAFASVAAVLLFALLLWWPQASRRQFETVTTMPGETRTLALGGTIRIEMNGATELAFARGDAPVVRLEAGEAAFYIDSPEPSKLRVETGGLVLVDRGTSFDVIHDRFGVRVAVGSGKVVVDPEGEAIALAPGDTLRAPADGDTRVIGHIAPADMASWRENRLSWRDAPLPMVAADLARALGVPVTVAPGLSQARLTGVVPTTGKPAEVIASAALLAGGIARQHGEEWIIAPR